MNIEELLATYRDILAVTGLTYRDLVIGAGGAMMLLGLRETTTDLDIDCDLRALFRAAVTFDKYAEPSCPPVYLQDGFIVRVPERNADFHTSLVPTQNRGDMVIYDHYNKVSYQHPLAILAMKRKLGREKDLVDIERIKQYLTEKLQNANSMADYYTDTAFTYHPDNSDHPPCLGVFGTALMAALVSYSYNDGGVITSDDQWAFLESNIVKEAATILGIDCENDPVGLPDLLTYALQHPAPNSETITQAVVDACDEYFDEYDPDGVIELGSLILVLAAEPGANVRGVSYNGSFTCSKPRRDAYGEWRAIQSVNYRRHTDTQFQEAEMCDVDTALARGDLQAVGKRLARLAVIPLYGIQSDKTRQTVSRYMVNEVLGYCRDHSGVDELESLLDDQVYQSSAIRQRHNALSKLMQSATQPPWDDDDEDDVDDVERYTTIYGD